MSAQELANGISYSGHMYAMSRAARSLTPAGHLQEVFGGMDQVREASVQEGGDQYTLLTPHPKKERLHIRLRTVHIHYESTGEGDLIGQCFV